MIDDGAPPANRFATRYSREVDDYDRWRRALAGEALPAAVVDLDALEHNQDVLLARLGAGLTLRVASKSVRVPGVMRRLLDRGGERLRGLMTFAAAEAALLVDQGFDDLLIAYPVGREADAQVVAGLAARGARVYATVDAADQVELLARAARGAGATVPLCLDVDASWRPLGGVAHFGVRRSPVRSGGAARALARLIRDTEGVSLEAVLAYEAQVAGIRERNPTSRHLDPIRRFIKRRSEPLAKTRRAEVLAALRADGHAVEVVNGGGTGSMVSTSADPSVTEVTAGSGFFCSHLFDGYDGLPLRPAALFALAVVRRSDPDYLTCGGGGYIASGGAGADRLPIVHLPGGLEPVALEGFGEVQTPLKRVAGAPELALGDPILCRHAKAGELMERFSEVLLVRGDAVVERAPTYRGLGGCFL